MNFVLTISNFYFCTQIFSMILKTVDVVADISADEFRTKYFQPGIPVVIQNLSKQWPAYNKWNWDYFKQIVGEKK